MKYSAEPGTVYLIGAGPGEADLITVRGLALLRRADVVVYDRLVAPELLDEIRPSAERIYVGKEAGRHHCPQAEINELLVRHARRSRVVVRLKGGDPFVFGRGGEEALALVAAGLRFEVVPGVTSAIAAPAYAGIPVTHRGVSTAFTVVTGHTCDSVELDWEALSKAGTLVILMGLERLDRIAERLIRYGRAPETPVAVVSCGGTSGQVVCEGVLATIARDAAGVASPATIVVGEVVRLRHALAWFEAPAAGASSFPLTFPAPALVA